MGTSADDDVSPATIRRRELLKRVEQQLTSVPHDLVKKTVLFLEQKRGGGSR